MNTRRTAILAFAFLIVAAGVASVQAQRRDYLTAAEIELVRDAQEIDLRIMVLTTAVDRRFVVLNNQIPPKENEKWGPLPKGSRRDLIMDIQKIIQKAVDDIDDVAARNIESKIFPKAIWKLADSCTAYGPKFKTLLDSVSEDKERGSILSSLDLCSQVAEAAARVPREPLKEDKKKKQSNN